MRTQGWNPNLIGLVSLKIRDTEYFLTHLFSLIQQGVYILPVKTASTKTALMSLDLACLTSGIVRNKYLLPDMHPYSSVQ